MSRSLGEDFAPLPERARCSTPEYVAFRRTVVERVQNGATPATVAAMLGDALDTFPGLYSGLMDEMRLYAEMGDKWLPPMRRDLWEHYREMPVVHRFFQPTAVLDAPERREIDTSADDLPPMDADDDSDIPF